MKNHENKIKLTYFTGMYTEDDSKYVNNDEIIAFTLTESNQIIVETAEKKYFCSSMTFDNDTVELSKNNNLMYPMFTLKNVKTDFDMTIPTIQVASKDEKEKMFMIRGLIRKFIWNPEYQLTLNEACMLYSDCLPSVLKQNH